MFDPTYPDGVDVKSVISCSTSSDDDVAWGMGRGETTDTCVGDQLAVAHRYTQ